MNKITIHINDLFELLERCKKKELALYRTGPDFTYFIGDDLKLRYVTGDQYDPYINYKNNPCQIVVEEGNRKDVLKGLRKTIEH